MTREELKELYGDVWNTQELQRDFKVNSFLAPLVLVERKEDNKHGTLQFQHSPRYYFKFEET